MIRALEPPASIESIESIDSIKSVESIKSIESTLERLANGLWDDDADPRLDRPRGSSSVGGVPVETIRADFPILNERVHGRPLIFLDNAATTQRPNSVIERVARYYSREHSNVHRGAHELAARATDAYEDARRETAAFIGADASEIVFVRGATEALNLVARSFARPRLKPGDEILLTELEHHANIVPWQLIAKETGAGIAVCPVDGGGQLMLGEFERMITPRTKFVSMTHVSNATGLVMPVREAAAIARRKRVPICVDGAQSAAHMPINVKELGCDFYAFSGHKALGPTGIGALYGRSDMLEQGEPYQGGGNMILDVTFESTRYQPAPARFEAGTGNIAGAAGLAEALRYMRRIGMEAIERREDELMEYMAEELRRVPGVRIIGGERLRRVCAVSFNIEGVPDAKVGEALDRRGIAVRAGHHCAQPGLRRFGVESTVRPSVSFYNTFGEIDELARALRGL
ncbi:MAG: cysteine desulfurase [Oscillospiraceae bacterium]|jgi:cysteine desulfurase/selenocysteine lyase|nr:cysteine desulfurase [Oscillospiraceae bacterium]